MNYPNTYQNITTTDSTTNVNIPQGSGYIPGYYSGSATVTLPASNAVWSAPTPSYVAAIMLPGEKKIQEVQVGEVNVYMDALGIHVTVTLARALKQSLRKVGAKIKRMLIDYDHKHIVLKDLEIDSISLLGTTAEIVSMHSTHPVLPIWRDGGILRREHNHLVIDGSLEDVMEATT